MKKLLAVLTSSILLTACVSENSNDQDLIGDDGTSTGGGPRIETHRVCKHVEDNEGDSLLTANKAINKSESWLLIESMVEAASASTDEIDSLPEADQLEGAFAITAFLAPSFTDAFTGFNIFYVCTEAMYALNQCNWENDYQQEGTLKVETVLGSGQNYTTTVSTKADASASLQQTLVLQGTIGDLGNITLDFYEEGSNVGSRQATLTDDGTETVRWTSPSTNWTASETSNCSGSLEYEDIRDNDTITLNAQWNFTGTSTSGTLDYQRVGDTSSALSIDW